MSARIGRRRGASTSREEILLAATDIIREGDLEQASVRKIAGRAKVDPAMIYRHFGSKDALFDELIARETRGVITPGTPARSGAEIVSYALDLWDSPHRRSLAMGLIRAAISNERAAGFLREVLGRTILHWLETSVRDDHRELRVSLIASQIVGMALMRHRLRLPGMRRASRAELVAVVGPVVEHYLRGDLGVRADERRAP